VIPDIITTAKGLTSGTVPMGAVLIRDDIYQQFMSKPGDAIEIYPEFGIRPFVDAPKVIQP